MSRLLPFSARASALRSGSARGTWCFLRLRWPLVNGSVAVVSGSPKSKGPNFCRSGNTPSFSKLSVIQTRNLPRSSKVYILKCGMPSIWTGMRAVCLANSMTASKKTIVDTANIRENIPQTKWNADCRHRLRVNYPLDINKPTLGPYHVTHAANSLVAGYELANRLFALPPRKASYESAGCFRGGESTWERSCCWNCSCGKVWHHFFSRSNDNTLDWYSMPGGGGLVGLGGRCLPQCVL